MTEQTSVMLTDAPLIDSVFGYCAKNDLQVHELSLLPFGDISFRLGELAEKWPEWIYASMEIRHHGVAICHEACHLERIKTFMKEWVADGRPGAKPQAGNVVQLFPTNSTKH